ncbi:hypothetical protein TRIUR3_25747 [Triticum urartu]|uniref:Uncharacterized protein n=1 Tax=Triticum urartu TaxID=4572 RepID=M8AEV3_TRIUA|nr:hypothetical protein TRIUR3_25747 [Triticum urartu]
MEHGRACTHPSLGGGGAGFWSPEELMTSSNGGERQTTTARRTSNQSTAERRPGGPEDHPEAVDQLGEAIGGAKGDLEDPKITLKLWIRGGKP